MKKTLAMLLAVLVALSMFAVAAFAAEGDITVQFKNGDAIVGTVTLKPGAIDDITPNIPENPVKASDGEYEYTFKGWQLEGDDSGKLYFKNTIEAPGADYAGQTITYVAVFSAEEITPTQTFWNFIESIFARINTIFQYFAEIFRFDI